MTPRLSDSQTTGALPVAPSMGPALAAAHVGHKDRSVDSRTLIVSAWAIAIGVLMGGIAQLLGRAIGLVTNVAFYGRLSFAVASPADHHLGYWVILVPPVGGVIVGVLARFGSPAIRGHGIPEAMERILAHESRIPARLTWLKPLSAAIAIGTGGPFGAEGPIIATGGALGSLLGQFLHVSSSERKALLAAGAAAGMAATFGSPVAAVLLAIELLLFELRPRSVIPVGLAAAAAAGVRVALVGAEPVFVLAPVEAAGAGGIAVYALLGGAVGLASVYVTHGVYWVEDVFERLPIHWMWWPAIGGLAVGAVGIVSPHTLGVGYDNIQAILAGHLAVAAIATLAAWKFLSWVIALGSGTSGGTLAPLLTIGGGVGVVLGALFMHITPWAGISLAVAGVVGMAAMFAGASRAVLASALFALETTHAPNMMAPLLAGCIAAHLVSCLRMKDSIMTMKIERRGVRVPSEYAPDPLSQLPCAAALVPTTDLPAEVSAAPHVAADAPLSVVIARLAEDPGRPIAITSGAGDERLIGMVTAGSALAALRGYYTKPERLSTGRRLGFPRFMR